MLIFNFIQIKENHNVDSWLKKYPNLHNIWAFNMMKVFIGFNPIYLRKKAPNIEHFSFYSKYFRTIVFLTVFS